MARGILDEYMGAPRSEGHEQDARTVQVTVRVEHTTARAVQVSQDGGQTVVWIPREAILGQSIRNFGPGDTLRIDVTEKTAEDKGLE